MKTIYCIEHSVNDFENEYIEIKKKAIEEAKLLRELIANGEHEEEIIWITYGEMNEDGDYSSEGTIEF